MNREYSFSSDIDQQIKLKNNKESKSDVGYIHAALFVRDILKKKTRLKFDHQSVRRRNFYYKFRYARRILMALYISTAVFEKPLWCEDKEYPYSCKVDGNDVPLSGIPILPQRITYSFEAVIVIFFLCMNFLRNSYVVKSRTSQARFMLISLLCVLVLGDIGQVLVTDRRPYIAHFARVILFVIYLRSVRESLFRVFVVIHKARYVLILLILHIFIFGWMANFLFRDLYKDYQYFHSFHDSLWSMLILLSTANFPDIMMPAYLENQAYCLFFIFYLVIGLLVLQRLMLAVLYNDYKNHIQSIVTKFFKSQHSDPKSINISQRLSYTQYSPELLERFYRETIVGDIPQLTFFNNIITYKQSVIMSESHIFFKVFPTLYNKYSDRIDSILSSFIYESVINVILIGNGLVYFLVDTHDSSIVEVWCYGQIPINIMLLGEVALISFIIGPKAYFKSFRRIMWFGMILTSFAAILVFGVKYDERHNAFLAMTYIGLIRMWRILGILNCVEKYRIIFKTLLDLIPTFTNLLSVIVVLFYVFSLLGQELFGGLIYEENSDLVNPIVPISYVYNNFNDFTSGVVTLFELLIVNNWWVIAEMYVDATSKYARIYFGVFFILAVLVVFNLFLAFIIDILDCQMKYKQNTKLRPKSPQHSSQLSDTEEQNLAEDTEITMKED